MLSACLDLLSEEKSSCISSGDGGGNGRGCRNDDLKVIECLLVAASGCLVQSYLVASAVEERV